MGDFIPSRRAGARSGLPVSSLPPAYSSKATRNGIRVSDLKDMAVFGDKLRKLSLDGSKRFGADYQYDVDGEIAKYTEIAPTVKVWGGEGKARGAVSNAPLVCTS